jgi:hypothetical protein
MIVPVKATALLLVLAFGSLQGVSMTDCPCGSLCESKNACPDEKRHESSDDCCSRTRAKDLPATENCFHLEPQTDLDQVSAERCPVPLLILGVVDLPVLVLAATDGREPPPRCGLAPPSLDGPLFLLHSRLLI